MACTVEVVVDEVSTTARTMLSAFAVAAAKTDDVVITEEYQGGSDWLCLWGVGREPRSEWRDTHIAAGGHVLLFDMGYFGRLPPPGYLRASIDQDHPQAWIERTIPDPSRWLAHGIELREDYDPEGQVIVVGLGRKSMAYYQAYQWEDQTLTRIAKQFPDRLITFRPKPTKRDWRETPIETLLRGASLVVCRHSNVAIDAVIAGVPFEADDGAAVWLKGKPYTRETRLDFLRRLAWWQWKPTEATQAWRFIKGIVNAA